MGHPFCTHCPHHPHWTEAPPHFLSPVLGGKTVSVLSLKESEFGHRSACECNILMVFEPKAPERLQKEPLPSPFLPRGKAHISHERCPSCTRKKKELSVEMGSPWQDESVQITLETTVFPAAVGPLRASVVKD